MTRFRYASKSTFRIARPRMPWSSASTSCCRQPAVAVHRDVLDGQQGRFEECARAPGAGQDGRADDETDARPSARRAAQTLARAGPDVRTAEAPIGGRGDARGRRRQPRAATRGSCPHLLGAERPKNPLGQRADRARAKRDDDVARLSESRPMAAAAWSKSGTTCRLLTCAPHRTRPACRDVTPGIGASPAG